MMPPAIAPMLSFELAVVGELEDELGKKEAVGVGSMMKLTGMDEYMVACGTDTEDDAVTCVTNRMSGSFMYG
jgi:hypothetical protein